MKTEHTKHSIGYDTAVKLADNGWWKKKTPAEIMRFQFFTAELAMPFKEFQDAVAETLGHPVFTATMVNGGGLLASEFLKGQPQPTAEEIQAFAADNL